MIAVTPLFRGSVHAWAQTVIQAMVALGGIVLVLEAMRSKAGRKRSSRDQKGFASRELVLYVAGPCAALGVWSAVMSPHPALVFQGLIMLATCLGFQDRVRQTQKPQPPDLGHRLGLHGRRRRPPHPQLLRRQPPHPRQRPPLHRPHRRRPPQSLKPEPGVRPALL
jgi:hypothetical protein